MCNKSKVNTFHWYSMVAVCVWPLAPVFFLDLPNVKWLNAVPQANTDVQDCVSSPWNVIRFLSCFKGISKNTGIIMFTKSRPEQCLGDWQNYGNKHTQSIYMLPLAVNTGTNI